MMTLDDFIDIKENLHYTYFIFDQWIPVSNTQDVPLFSFFPDEDKMENKLELPPHIAVDTFNGFVAFVIRNDSLQANEYIEIDVSKRDDSIANFLAMAKLPNYTQSQIEASLPDDEVYPEIEDGE